MKRSKHKQNSEGGVIIFEFKATEHLKDGEIYLKLARTISALVAKVGVPVYAFNICLIHSDIVVGEINLRIGDNLNIFYNGNIGYEVVPAHRGNHYALKASKLLLPFAKQHGLQTLAITCNPDNFASRRICELLDAKLLQIVDLPQDNDLYLEGEQQKCIYSIDL